MSTPIIDADDDLYYQELDNGASDRSGTVTYREEADEIKVLWTEKPDGEELEMLSFVLSDELLRIFPKSISSGILQPAFTQIKELQLEQSKWATYDRSQMNDRFGLLQANGLPRGFSGVYAFGIGIKRDFRGFVHLIEEHTACSVVRFVRAGREGVSDDGSTFTVTYDLFDEYRSVVKRNKGRGYQAVARVRIAQTHNVLASVLNVKPKEVKYGRNPVINAMTEEVEHGYVITASDRDLLVTKVAQEAKKVAVETPSTFFKLRSDIELVSLDTLIEKFETDLSGRFKNDEKHWQAFFEENPFALKQLFAMPLTIFQREAEVKSGNVSGTGRRVTDFLCLNPVTRVAMVIEVKSPATQLMQKGSYRGKEDATVFAVSSDLSGAIAQLQGQMISTQADLPARLKSKDEIDVWGDVRGAIIAGKFDDLSEEQKSSFLRFRAGLTNITILTYDEVLARLKELRDEMQSTAFGSTERE